MCEWLSTRPTLEDEAAYGAAGVTGRIYDPEDDVYNLYYITGWPARN
jgi:hypothetical protein